MRGYLTDYGRKLIEQGTTGPAMYDDDIPRTNGYLTKLHYLDPDFRDPWIGGPNEDFLEHASIGVRRSTDSRSKKRG